MADQGRWFKLWAESLSDPHLGNLTVADFGRWAKFGVYLKVHGTDGSIVLTPPSRVLLAALQIDTFEALLTCLGTFPNCQIRRDDDSHDNGHGNVTVTWANWRKYQVDSSAERQRRYRHRQAFGVTTKKRGEERRREERRSNPPIVPPEGGTRAFKAEARDVLGWLNEKVGKRFEFIPANLGPIEARLREGREVWQLKKVVSVKAKAWATDEKMREYLRPATLFNKTKCAQYVGELPAGGVE